MPGSALHTRETDRRPAPGAVLITGATGFLGREVMTRYLERTDRHIFALVRARDAREAESRLRESLDGTVPGDPQSSARVTAVAGDIEAEGLGLDSARRERLAEELTDVVHAAASVSFTLPLDQARSVNVDGTRRLLELATLCQHRGGLRRFSYVSTAYVAGTHDGSFHEHDLDLGQGFHNSYERTKFEAERVVHDHADRLPVQVLRPSIIVGERPSGWTGSFNVLYAPLKAFAGGALHAIPARGSAPIDVVPVDYVADAVLELASGGADDDGTFHLVAGPEAPTIRGVVGMAAGHLRRRRPLTLPPAFYRRVVHPVLLRLSGARRRRALERMEVFFPYFENRVTYDNRRTRERLDPTGVRTTPLEGYFGRLIDFADRARWGRRPISRARARAQA
jgi:thioester reductase-like protein